MAEEETNPANSGDVRGENTAAGGDRAAFIACTSQLATGDLDYEAFLLQMQEAALQSMGPDHPHYQQAQQRVKLENLKRRRSRSSETCRNLLERLYQPIREKLHNGSYSGEGGSLVYQKDLENLKEEYVAADLEVLGPMKGAELVEFMASHSGQLVTVEDVDARATEKAETQQASLLRSLDVLLTLFEDFELAYKDWALTRYDNIIWLELKADSLDNMKKKGNIAAAGTAGVGIAAGAAGTAVFVSALLAVTTFGVSFAITAAAGLAAGGTGVGCKYIERKYNIDAIKEQVERLEEDNRRMGALKTVLNDLVQHAEGIKEIAGINIGGFASEQVSSDNAGTGSTGIEVVKDAAYTGFKGVVLPYADEALNAAKMVGQMADDVLDATKAGLSAAKALSGIAVALGGLSVILDTIALVSAVKDLQAGSKSEMAPKLREKATELNTDACRVCVATNDNKRMVNEAEAQIKLLLKRKLWNPASN